MKKPQKSTLVAVTSVVIALGIAATGWAHASESPAPITTETALPDPVNPPASDPAPVEAPPEVPAVPEVPAPESKPITAAESLPTATTVKEAVTVAISTYCPAHNASSVDPAKWNLIDGSEVNAYGYWEVWANTPSGILYVSVTPQGDTAIVAPMQGVAESAFAYWGCPSAMAVASP